MNTVIYYNRIKVVMVSKGYTNKLLALFMNKTEATISNWVTNKTQPTIPELWEIANLWHVEIAELLNSNLNIKKQQNNSPNSE